MKALALQLDCKVLNTVLIADVKQSVYTLSVTATCQNAMSILLLALGFGLLWLLGRGSWSLGTTSLRSTVAVRAPTLTVIRSPKALTTCSKAYMLEL